MIEKTIQIFTDKEEEFINLLVRIGTKKAVAKTLLFLGKMKEATSRNIELGADLRQPEVSIATKYLLDKGWADYREVSPEMKGRPIKIWNLTVPVEKILDAISREKQAELKARMEAIQKVRCFA